MKRSMCAIVMLVSVLVLACVRIPTPTQTEVVLTPSLAQAEETSTISPPETLAKAEEAAFGQENDGTEEFKKYSFILKSDPNAMTVFYDREGKALSASFHLRKISSKVMNEPRYLGPYLAAVYARHQWVQAEKARRSSGSWRQREYLAAALLLERIIADRSPGWHKLAMEMAAICDDHRTLERYRGIALAPKTAQLLEHAGQPRSLDGQDLQRDIEQYRDVVHGFCGDPNNQQRIASSESFVALCAYNVLDATYIAEKRRKHPDFEKNAIRQAAELAYRYHLLLAPMDYFGAKHTEAAIQAAKIARAHDLGQDKEKEAARQAIALIVAQSHWNAFIESEFATAYRIVRLMLEWKIEGIERQAVCGEIVKRQSDWYRNPTVLHECGGSVTADEISRTGFRRPQAEAYLDSSWLKRLEVLSSQDLVRYMRAAVVACDRHLPSQCSRASLQTCPVPRVIEHISISECARTWLAVTAVSLDDTERQSAGRNALGFLKLDALAWKQKAMGQSRVTQQGIENDRRHRSLAVEIARNALAFIRVEGRSASDRVPFEQLLVDLFK